jgi:hypothetical protein
MTWASINIFQRDWARSTDFDEMDPVSLERVSLWRRCSVAIHHNPIGALALTAAIITLVLYKIVDTAVVSVTMARQELSQATGRIDGLVKDEATTALTVSYIKDKVENIDKATSDIPKIEQSLREVAAIAKSDRPYEIRLIESLGLAVDSELVVSLVDGAVVAFPASENRRQQLVNAGFAITDASISAPFNAKGYKLPARYAVISGTGGVAGIATPFQRSPKP